jgi:hypothetical protein
VVGTNLAQIAFGVRCVFASVFTYVNRCSFLVCNHAPRTPKSAARESAEALAPQCPLVTE